MKYMGSKNRHAKEIIPIIIEGRTEDQFYVEPFVGGANVIDKVGGLRIGADINPYLISLLDAIKSGWVPPDNVSEDEYRLLKNGGINNPLVGFAGFGCSFGGKFFGGYARGKNNSGTTRNYASETKRNLLKQAKNLSGIKFICEKYQDLIIPENSIIYCDPPYKGTTEYVASGFDHDAFWSWCALKVNGGHKVFVSEYSAPVDWVCVWEKKTAANFDSARSSASERIEKLFVHKSQAAID